MFEISIEFYFMSITYFLLLIHDGNCIFILQIISNQNQCVLYILIINMGDTLTKCYNVGNCYTCYADLSTLIERTTPMDTEGNMRP